jgi:ankyrin repeat protein
LLDKGAAVDWINRYGKTALREAAARKYEAIV